MQAWVCRELTGEDGLALESQESPACGPDQIKVRNHWAALNFPDVLITRGQYQLKLDPPFTPGSESSGVILEVGENVRGFTAGQRVMVMSGFGAFAQELVVAPPFQQIRAIPDSMSFEDAAAFNMTYGTGMHGLRQRGKLQAGETLLVLGAAGGCGSAAVEIGKAMGARVIAGASSDDKCAMARQLGADEVINYRKEDLRDRVMALTGKQGVDVIFDPVGDALFDQARRCAGWNCRYLIVGFAGGEIPSFPVNYSILKSMSVVGVAYGMSAIRDPAMNEDNFRELFDWYSAGRLKPHIGRRWELNELPEALREMHAGHTLGKSVVQLGGAINPD